MIEFSALGDKPAVYAPLISAVTSDADGRFTLKGIGADRVAEIYIDGLPASASSLILVATRNLDRVIVVPEETPAAKKRISNGGVDLAIYGAQLETVVGPGRTIEGFVTDRATDWPVAAAKIIGPAITRLEYPGFDRFFATTDDQGYYCAPRHGSQARAHREFPDDGEPRHRTGEEQDRRASQFCRQP